MKVGASAAITALALCGVLTFGSRAHADPIQLTGTVLNFDAGNPNADYFKIASQLGYIPAAMGTVYSLVAFDLSGLDFDPTAVLLVDDGSPLGDSLSSLASSGLDIDAAGGYTLSNTPNYATSVYTFVPGQRISPADNAVSATFVDDLTNTLPDSERTLAAPGGTGGCCYLFGVADNALGAPDAALNTTQASGFIAIGSGGQLSLLFASPINRNGNIGGTIYDFVYWDTGGAGDNGFLLFDDQPIAAVPEPGTMMLLGSGLALLSLRLRGRRASK